MCGSQRGRETRCEVSRTEGSLDTHATAPNLATLPPTEGEEDEERTDEVALPLGRQQPGLCFMDVCVCVQV
jgi:hypothetical protein